MRPKKPILLYCADRELLSATAFALRLHPYRVVATEDSTEASLMAGDRCVGFACAVVIHAQQGDLTGRLIYRILERAAHMPLLLVDRAGDLSPVRYVDAVHGGLIPGLAYGGNNTAGPIDVSTAINACFSAPRRIDFDTETFITHPLYADSWDAGEDGTGRGTPMVPVTIRAVDPQPNYDGSSDGVARSSESDNTPPVAFNLRGRDGGAMPETSQTASLRASTGGSSNSYVAFSAKDYGADVDEIAPTLRGMGHDESHANGGGQVAVAASTNQRGELREREIHGSLNSSRGGGNQFAGVTQQMAVRRLTPRECERLQGFPDDYTLVEYRGRLSADGPRYRALGNSMAVPVMRWIGQRIAAVHEIVPRRFS